MSRMTAPRPAVVVGALALSLMAGTVDARTIIECRTSAGDGHPWAWRQIAGKRCWYRGRRGMDRALLAWPAKALPAPPIEPPAVALPPPPPPPAIALASVPESPPPPVRVIEVPVRVVGNALPPPERLAVAKPLPPAPGPGNWIGPLLVIAMTGGIAYVIARRRLRSLNVGS